MNRRLHASLCWLTGICISFLAAGQSTAEKSLLAVTIEDGTTLRKTPARVRITTNNRAVKSLPSEAIAVMYGMWDHADGYGFLPDSAFYVDGFFGLELPAGDYKLEITKGIEYLAQQHVIKLAPGKSVKLRFSLQRWIDMPSKGWYAADDHIHVRRSPREDSLLLKWIQAEDINVGVLLRMGDFWATYYEQYGWGEEAVFQQGNYLLTSGQEDPRTPELGHAIGIGATDKVRFQSEYYYYDKVFDKLHELGGLTGYAHQAESFHGYRGLVMDGLRRKVDMLELVQYCISEQPLHTRHYYHLLDLGYSVTAIAGSDFPWCGRDHNNGRPERNARIGNARFYAKLDGAFTFSKWKNALRKGHTFVTTGPMLELTINGKIPGDTIRLKRGENLSITAEAYGTGSKYPLKDLAIVRHGEVYMEVHAGNKAQTAEHLSIETSFTPSESCWIAARAFGQGNDAAHTTPVYVMIDNKGFHNPEKVDYYLTLSETYLSALGDEIQKINDDPQFQGWRYRKGIEKRIEEVREVIAQLRTKLK